LEKKAAVGEYLVFSWNMLLMLTRIRTAGASGATEMRNYRKMKQITNYSLYDAFGRNT